MSSQIVVSIIYFSEILILLDFSKAYKYLCVRLREWTSEKKIGANWPAIAISEKRGVKMLSAYPRNHTPSIYVRNTAKLFHCCEIHDKSLILKVFSPLSANYLHNNLRLTL